MKRWRKSNRVTWAPDVRLSQVKLFSTEDCPSKVCKQAQQYHVKHKIPTGILQKRNSRGAADLPPGFEDSHLQFPKIQWKCPPKFGLSTDWCVASGEESQELRVQKQREMSLFEAVYPRLSVIPPNPSNLLNVECESCDDSRVPIIPLVPIEEDSEALVPLCHIPEQVDTPMKCQPPSSALELSHIGNHIPSLAPPSELSVSKKQGPGTVPIQHQNPAVSFAASTLAAVNAASIDTDLLVKILNDPNMIQRLVGDTLKPTADIGNPPNQPMLSASMPADAQPTVSRTSPKSNLGPNFWTNQTSIVAPTFLPRSDPIYADLNRVQPVAPSATTKPYIQQHSAPPVPQFGPAEPSMVAPMGTNHVKDFDYFKNLIRQHGADMEKTQFRGAPNSVGATDYGDPIRENRKMKEVNAKFHKSCMYFKSSRGCRSGENCRYRHDMSFQLQTGYGLDTVPCAKRMRFNGQVSGRT